MIAGWMLYAMAIGGCAVAAALALESLVAARGWQRRWVWVGALFASVLVPVAMAVRPVTVAASHAPPNPLVPDATLREVVAAVGVTRDWDRWLLATWCGLSLVMAGALLASAWQVVRARRLARVTWLDGEPVGLTSDVGPGVLWFGTPRIVVPAWLDTLTAERRALLVRHEVEHVRAGDPWLLLVSIAAVVLAPWNVALWCIAARLRSALELDCDARVLAAGADVRRYGDLLLAVAAGRRARRLQPCLALAVPSSALERRIRAMTSRPTPGTARQLSMIGVLLAVTVLACETRRPDPVAPVASYTIDDGLASPRRAASVEVDSVRQAIAGRLRMHGSAPVVAGDPDVPLLMIYDAEGTLLLSGRIGSRGADGRPALDSLPVRPADIARVEVVKQGAVLPPEARSGLILVTLKPGHGLRGSR